MVHRAVDGATVAGLAAQRRGIQVPEQAVVLLSVGGNDLLQGLILGGARDFGGFRRSLRAASRTSTTRGSSSPTSTTRRSATIGGTSWTSDPPFARRAHDQVNEILREEAGRAGAWSTSTRTSGYG